MSAHFGEQHRRIFHLITLALGIWGVVPSLLWAVPTADELERAVVSQRQAIHSGELRLVAQTYRDGASEPQAVHEAEVWFSGEQMRCDMVRRTEQSSDAYRILECLNCPAKGYVTELSETNPDRPTDAVTVRQVPNDFSISQTVNLFDPRILGVTPSKFSLYRHAHLEEFLLRPDRTGDAVTETTWEGQPAWELTIDLEDGVQIKAVVVPSLGNSVTRFQGGTTIDGHSYLYQVDSTIARTEPEGIYYPSECVFTETHDDKLVTQEIITVEHVRLNNPIPPETFELEGMKIRSGSYVQGHPNAAEQTGMFWEGTDLVHREHQLGQPQPTPEPIGGKHRWWLLGVAIGLALVTGLLAWYGLARKTPAKT